MSLRRRTVVAGLLAAAAAAPGVPVRAAEEKKKGGGDSYLQLPALTAPLLRPGGLSTVLTAEAGIDTPDPVLRARVLLLQPRLQDAYNSVMAAFAASLAPGALPDVDALVARLQAATDRIVGRPGARFLIGTVLAG